jgi:hypothetical protein
VKKFLVVLILFLFIFGCTSRTRYGECIGISDSENPALVYKISKWNVFLGIVFWETIIVPVWITLWEIKCPVAKQAAPEVSR